MRITMAAVAVLGALALATAVRAAAPDAAEPTWDRLRGPNGEGLGRASALPVRWTEADYAWKVELPGGGHGSPVAWGDRLFVTSAAADTAQRIVLCLRAADGAAVWRKEFESKTCHLHAYNSYATTTPAVDARRVYVCWAVPEEVTLLALDHEGREVWRRNLGPFKSQHGHGASPIVFEDLVVLANDQDGPSFVIAVDSRTGETRWQTDRRSDRAAYSTPCVRRRPDGTAELVFTSTANGMTGLEARSGRPVWEVPDAFPQRVVSSPVVVGDLVLGSCGTGSVGQHVVAVRPPSAPGGQAEVAYKVERSAPYVPSAVAWKDLVFLFGDTGTVQCVRAATGQEVWRERVGANFFGSPVCVDGRLYAISTKGEVLVLAASEKYELLARNPLGEKSHATPVVAGGRMILRTWSHLIALGGGK